MPRAAGSAGTVAGALLEAADVASYRTCDQRMAVHHPHIHKCPRNPFLGKRDHRSALPTHLHFRLASSAPTLLRIIMLRSTNDQLGTTHKNPHPNPPTQSCTYKPTHQPPHHP